MNNLLGTSPRWIKQRVVASDGAPKNWFGCWVALSGSTAFISAKTAAVNGNASQGAVYVFNKVKGQWVQVQKLVANDGQSGDQFGTAVFLSEKLAVITAPLARVGNNVWQGAAYVFGLVDGHWVQTHKLVSGSGFPFQTFGDAVTAAPGTIFVSSGGANHLGEYVTRRVHVFSIGKGTATGVRPVWTETQVLESPVPEDTTSSFGASLAYASATLLVGARSTTVDGRIGQGVVFVYASAPKGWSQSERIVLPDGKARENFGVSIAADGNSAFIGAPGTIVNGNVSQGAVYRFGRVGGSWTQGARYTSPTKASLLQYGASVSSSSGRVLVGAYGEDSYRGAAYIFNEVALDPVNQLRLQPSESSPGEVFGYNTALYGNTALIGSWTASVNGNSEQGAAYFYEYTT